jgi:hypothetical protein
MNFWNNFFILRIFSRVEQQQQQRPTPAQGKIKQVLRLGDTSVAAPLVFGHSGRGERRTTMAGQNKSPARGETARGRSEFQHDAVDASGKPEDARRRRARAGPELERGQNWREAGVGAGPEELALGMKAMTEFLRVAVELLEIGFRTDL